MEVLHYSYENSVFHRKALDKGGLKPANVRSITDLQKLKFFTTKDALRKEVPFRDACCPEGQGCGNACGFGPDWHACAGPSRRKRHRRLRGDLSSVPHHGEEEGWATEYQIKLARVDLVDKVAIVVEPKEKVQGPIVKEKLAVDLREEILLFHPEVTIADPNAPPRVEVGKAKRMYNERTSSQAPRLSLESLKELGLAS